MLIVIELYVFIFVVIGLIVEVPILDLQMSKCLLRVFH